MVTINKRPNLWSAIGGRLANSIVYEIASTSSFVQVDIYKADGTKIATLKQRPFNGIAEVDISTILRSILLAEIEPESDTIFSSPQRTGDFYIAVSEYTGLPRAANVQFDIETPVNHNGFFAFNLLLRPPTNIPEWTQYLNVTPTVIPFYIGNATQLLSENTFQIIGTSIGSDPNHKLYITNAPFVAGYEAGLYFYRAADVVFGMSTPIVDNANPVHVVLMALDNDPNDATPYVILNTKWWGLLSSATCIKVDGQNTGFKAFALIEEYIPGSEVRTGRVKPNLPSDPDYYPPVLDGTTCPVATGLFYSAEQSGDLNKNDCPAGGFGLGVTYTVPAGKFYSVVSQADADAQAIAYFQQTAQDYANANGECSFRPAKPYISLNVVRNTNTDDLYFTSQYAIDNPNAFAVDPPLEVFYVGTNGSSEITGSIIILAGNFTANIKNMPRYQTVGSPDEYDWVVVPSTNYTS